MSFVVDQVRRLDAYLDQVEYSVDSSPSSPVLQSASLDGASSSHEKSADVGRIQEFQGMLKTLSTTSSSQGTLSPYKLRSTLERAVAAFQRDENDSVIAEKELQWYVVGKAAAQVYGHVLNALLDQILPISNDIWYWDEVLGSYRYIGLYTLQTTPLRWWNWGQTIYRDSKERFQEAVESGEPQLLDSITASWRRFYGIVRDTIHDRSLINIQYKLLSPIAQCRNDARAKQKALRRLRDLNSSGLGILMDEGFSFETDEFGAAVDDSWQLTVSKSILLMDVVLQQLAKNSPELTIQRIEDESFSHVNDYIDHEESKWNRPPALAKHLLNIISARLPNYQYSVQTSITESGRPSRLVRYWIPATALLLSSSTLLRIFFNRRQEILTWVRDLGQTTMDFWYNWVVDPIKKVIGTIRHDQDSEIALMSRESLEGDRASLERMVVDFAVDNPETTNGTSLSDAQIQEVRSKVREGDLTPVLKAYEKDLRKPFVGAMRGDLIRALLIQIQKTKVDVEVAMSGIDALLKSQELVFGFVGLTPGILVCVGVSRWLIGAFGRSNRSQQQKQGRMSRSLRNIDRVLTLSRPSSNQTLPYRDRGLLLCEVHVLRQLGERVLPGVVRREFLEDLNDLVEVRTGVPGQLRIVERIRWAYAKWIQ